MHEEKPFTFVGYLIQTPYYEDTRWPDCTVASISRELKPDFDIVRYETISGHTNCTKFLPSITEDLERKYTGDQSYTINAYSIEDSSIRTEKSLDGTPISSKYEFARHNTIKPSSRLKPLGYDIVDEPCHPLSMIHDAANREKLVDDFGGLNEFGLFESHEQARSFADKMITDDLGDATVWIVWEFRSSAK